MYREIGLLLVLLLPVAILYLSRQDDLQQRTQAKPKKSKKKNKKKPKATDIDTSPSSSTTSKPTVSETATVKPTSPDPSLNNDEEPSPSDSNTPSSNPPVVPQPKAKNMTKEVDDHMDLTVRYSRVMRIRPDTPDEPLAPVPFEDGWNQVKTIVKPRSTQPKDEPLTKKQRENQARAAKKKELKAQTDALQEQRLRQHQRQLEKEKIAAFYSTGAGKHTQWGSKPRKPQDQPFTTDERPDPDDQLIWD